MEIKTRYGTVDFDFDEIEEYKLSAEATKYLNTQKYAAEMFFTDEIDISKADAKYENIIQEFAENVIAGSKFDNPERAFALVRFLDDNTSLDDLEEMEHKDGGFIVDGSSEYLVLTDDEADEKAVEQEKDLLDDVGIDGLGDSLMDYILDNFVDVSWFDDVMDDSNREYAEDIKNDSSSDDDVYVNRLHEELVESGILDEPEWPDEDDFESYLSKDEYGSEPEPEPEEDEFESAHQEWVDEGVSKARDKQREHFEELVEDKIDDYVESKRGDYDSSVEWFKDNHGSKELARIVKSNNLVDYDEVARYLIDSNGRGNTLARHDGEENNISITYKNTDYDFFIYQTD